MSLMVYHIVLFECGEREAFWKSRKIQDSIQKFVDKYRNAMVGV